MNRESTLKHEKALILSGGGARGAYQVGVLKFLNEVGWQPSLVCGTSVGALNAVGIASGLELNDLVKLWKNIDSGKVFKISLWKKIINFIRRKGFTALMDTRPLRKMLEELVDLTSLHKEEIEVLIATVNILSSELRYFGNKEITVDHVMASSAIPGIFPWQFIDGEAYWDGGLMANTPILPALEREAKEIIVVLLSPVGGFTLELPKSQGKVIERVYEHTMLGSYQTIMTHLAWEKGVQSEQSILSNLTRRSIIVGDSKIATVAPTKMMGFSSLLNFSRTQSGELIEQGYKDARLQLADFFKLS